MSGVTATTVLAAAAVASTAVSVYNGMEQKKDAKNALAQNQQAAAEQKKAADAQAKTAEEQMNAANRKSANTASVLDAATQAGKQGASGTMLTGAQGIDPNALNLSKNTLLGG